MDIGKTLAQLRKNKGLTQDQMANILDVKRARYNSWENNIAKPDIEMINKLARFHKVSADHLLGISVPEKDEEGFTEKDRKDIGKRMDAIRKDLTNTDGLMFSGEPLSEEALDSLMDAMEYIVKHTKKVNKKYIPKKYRKEAE
ncbi:helix-turn-helix transcriptional regulator [Bacillus cereus]|uniref:Helix-turn-helix transcriptional regulator n=1 Tax=Bacillus cereus TaxID=1396 RepID=A0A9X9ABL1_BACCE|nr:helix-turn-helix transcriptional regulator [Bacillus cereus]